jgi:hypothetical protein
MNSYTFRAASQHYLGYWDSDAKANTRRIEMRGDSVSKSRGKPG